MSKILNADSECAVLNEVKTRKWSRFIHEKNKLAKNCSTRKTQIDSECAVLNEVKTRKWSRFIHEKNKLAKNCSTRKTQIGVENME